MVGWKASLLELVLPVSQTLTELFTTYCDIRFEVVCYSHFYNNSMHRSVVGDNCKSGCGDFTQNIRKKELLLVT